MGFVAAYCGLCGIVCQFRDEDEVEAEIWDDDVSDSASDCETKHTACPKDKITRENAEKRRSLEHWMGQRVVWGVQDMTCYRSPEYMQGDFPGFLSTSAGHPPLTVEFANASMTDTKDDPVVFGTMLHERCLSIVEDWADTRDVTLAEINIKLYHNRFPDRRAVGTFTEAQEPDMTMYDSNMLADKHMHRIHAKRQLQQILTLKRKHSEHSEQ